MYQLLLFQLKMTSAWSRNFLTDMTAIASPINATFNITGTNLYVPVLTLSTEDDKKLLE